MRRSLFCIFLAAAIANAQSVADLPSCSLSCFATAVSATSCGDTDYTCQCSAPNADTIKQSVTGCLAKSACSISDIEKIQSWSNTFCPNVLASASASATMSMTSSVAQSDQSSSPTSNSYPTSADPSSSSTVVPAAGLSSTSSSEAPGATKWGANTPGTAWHTMNGKSSSADRGPALEAVSIILLCVAAMILAFRFFARYYTKSMRQVVRGIGPDEWLAIPALISAAGITATIIVGVDNGMGKHMTADTTIATLIALLKIVYSFVIIISICFGTLKLSILCLYLRMTPEKTHKRVIYTIMGLVVAHTIASVVGAIFQCTPVSNFWSHPFQTLNDASCIRILPFDIFNSAWSVLEDVVIWAIPIPVVWKLKVSSKRKTGLYGLILVSLISVICAIARLASLIVWIRSTDISWNYILVPFISNVEACVAIITSSVPAILPMFRITARKPQEPPRPRQEPQKEWESQDSTAVPSTGRNTDRGSKTWSFLSNRLSLLKIKEKDEEGAPHLSPIKSGTGEYGMRTELKDLFEEESSHEVIPGLVKTDEIGHSTAG